MIRSGLILTSGNAAAALLGLVRNIVIARLISVEDFGIASTFAITMALVEMASNFSLDRLVVQARDGEERQLLSTLHAVQAIRGLLGAGVLFLVAGPIAALFNVPEVAWAYQALALIPLLRGLAHLDMFRRQRSMQFVPSATVEVSAQMLSSLAALPLALWLGDWRAMLCALLIQQLVFTAASHLVALRPYRWKWDGHVIRRTLRFGLPLLANGMLMFGIFQGDRIIVGTLIGMTELGWFSVALGLTLMPALLLSNILQTFFLPQLARAQDDVIEFRRLYLVAVQAALVNGLAIALGFAILGPPLLIILYGEKYASAIPLLAWLAIAQCLRVARAGPTIVAMSKGNTVNPLLSNVARVLILPVAWAAVSVGAGIQALVALAIIGEALALILSLLLLRRRVGLALGDLRVAFATSFAAIVLIGMQPYARTSEFSLVRPEAIDVAVVLAVFLACCSLRELRRWGRSILV